MNKVFYKGKQLSPVDMVVAANAITRNKPFVAYDFDYQNPECRIAGMGHCDCAGNGEFDLLPLNHPDVQDGKKRYMQCRKCGCWSHL